MSKIIKKNKKYMNKFIEISDKKEDKEDFDNIDITYKISDPKKAEFIIYKSINNFKLVSSINNSVDIKIDNIGIDKNIKYNKNNHNQ